MSLLKYWIWLSTADGIGPVAAMRLLRHFETPEKVYFASAREYSGVEGAATADFARLANKNLDAANKVLASCRQLGYRIITLQDAEYPDRLRNIYDPPLVLYVRGNLPAIDEEAAVAIVGTRNCTPYGITSAGNIACQLARHGILVVTGLARGIDTAAARGALKGGGRVIGVIGSGLDVVYPYENAALFGDVAVSGAVISEYPPGTPALRGHFPARNRILSGLSLGVAVIEAPKKSGALITATRALEQGRDVFTLPGNVDARSCEGSNSLLREGAIPVLSADDIISEYADLFPDKIDPDKQSAKAAQEENDGFYADNLLSGKNFSEKFISNGKKEIDNNSTVDYINLDEILSSLSGDEHVVANTIGAATMHIDEVIVTSGIPAQQVLTALTMLEISGHAMRLGNGKWKITKPDN